MTPIHYDPANPRHRARLELSIKNQWGRELHRLINGATGRLDDETAARLTAKYAKRWAEAGLDPNALGAPRAAEGVEPLPDPEPVQPIPDTYNGPTSAELGLEIEAEERNLTSVERLRTLRQQQALAKRHGA